MPMTMIEKILARAAGKDEATAGETVVCDVDLTVLIDLQFATAWIQPQRIADPDDRFRPKRSIISGRWRLRSLCSLSKIVIVSSKFLARLPGPIKSGRKSQRCRCIKSGRWLGSSNEMPG